MTHLTAGDLMNPDVLTVSAKWTVHELAKFFVEKAISGAPVADEAGNVVGVVSLTDIARYEASSNREMRADAPHDYYMHGWEQKLSAEDLSSFHIEEPVDTTVEDIMTRMVFKVKVTTPVKEIADIMIGGRVHRLLVTRNNRIVGIVTSLDLLKLIRNM